ncbi:aminotransferase class I/II-fold pyridoxal phosphate-dependent enzyme [Streptomyces sp. GSL17-111]|uniref:aminotransferase class I/II-fold pyridoxal phosphate-dependent enzyme n=1 Tax=Streptomyces sp. GSL17-111 TaxID=3121596 RepID=UPI0030F3A08D
MGFVLGDYRITGRRATEIADSVERGVSSGALPPGRALPALRDLAAHLGVNPNTVAAAYRTLRERGVVETAGRRGTRVRARPASTPREALRVAAPEGTRDLADGNPDTALLPSLEAALAEAAVRYTRRPTLYGAPAVSAELAALARVAFDADAVPDGPVAVTSGSLDAIERVLAAHLRPGDAVAVEDPGWGSALDLVPALGLRVLPVRVDDDGPLPGEVERALERGARALLVTSRAQNPTGAAVGAERAGDLRAVLGARPGTLLIEDDHGHGFVDLPPHTLAGATTRWAVLRSAAKAHGPDLRLAVLTGDELTLDRVRGRQALGPGWVSLLLQDAVTHLWREGAVDTAAVARSYTRRRAGLLAELARHGVAAHGRSGMNVWVPVPDETSAVAGLLRSGWAVAPGARFRLATPPGVRLTLSTLDVGELPGLAEDVAAALRPPQARRYG